jgi:hypothetical protein
MCLGNTLSTILTLSLPLLPKEHHPTLASGAVAATSH